MKKLLLTIATLLLLSTTYGQSGVTLDSISKNERIASPKVKVFPNPATTVVNILGLLNSSKAQITISDMNGKPVVSIEREIRKKALNIPVTALEPGLYVITVRSEEQYVKTKFYKK